MIYEGADYVEWTTNHTSSGAWRLLVEMKKDKGAELPLALAIISIEKIGPLTNTGVTCRIYKKADRLIPVLEKLKNQQLWRYFVCMVDSERNGIPFSIKVDGEKINGLHDNTPNSKKLLTSMEGPSFHYDLTNRDIRLKVSLYEEKSMPAGLWIERIGLTTCNIMKDSDLDWLFDFIPNDWKDDIEKLCIILQINLPLVRDRSNLLEMNEKRKEQIAATFAFAFYKVLAQAAAPAGKEKNQYRFNGWREDFITNITVENKLTSK
jgi:hypothetical protein